MDTMTSRWTRIFKETDMGEEMQEDTKVMINNLLWTILPPNTTLEKAELIAVEIYDKIRDLWEARCKEESQ